MHHVRSCMLTGCLLPFLAVYAEAILEVTKVSGWLTVDQALQRAGVPLAIVTTLLTNC